MTSAEKDELLDRYVWGDPLSEAEENQINAWLDADRAFRQAYWVKQELVEAGRRERRANWAAQHPTHNVPAPRPVPQPTSPPQLTFPFPRLHSRHRPFLIRWVAAASVLLLGLGLLWWTRQSATRSTHPDQSGPMATSNGLAPTVSGQAPLYERHDAQLGLAIGHDSTAVGTVTWEVRPADADTYVFSQADTLRLFSHQPTAWQGVQPRLTRLSETRYKLRVGSRTYLLDQGRDLRLPLRPEQ